MDLAARLESLTQSAQAHLSAKLTSQEWSHTAANLLDQHFSTFKFDPVTVLKQNIGQEVMAGATFPSLGFSHHPMTLVARETFNIDLYFWLPSDTLPHDHGFHGAFMPLSGDYAQTLYTFKEEIDLGEGVISGTLIKGETTLLPNNKAHVILHAPDFIHAVLHESFCVTLVLRSKNQGEVLSDYYPHFRLKNILLSAQRAQSFSQKLQLLTHLGADNLTGYLSQVKSGTLVRILLEGAGSPSWQKLVKAEASRREELRTYLEL